MGDLLTKFGLSTLTFAGTVFAVGYAALVAGIVLGYAALIGIATVLLGTSVGGLVVGLTFLLVGAGFLIWER